MERLIKSRCPRGVSILEIVAILAVMGVVLSYVMPISINRINRAKYEKSINEMAAIAQASIDYYNSQNLNTWPNDVSKLVPGYLYQVPTVNPWGIDGYHLTDQNGLIIVSTTIPTGIAQQDQDGLLLIVVPGSSSDKVSLAQSVPMNVSGRLLYDKNNS